MGMPFSKVIIAVAVVVAQVPSPEPTTRPTEPGYALCGMKDTDEGYPFVNRYFEGPAEDYAYRGEFQYYKSFPWISVQMRRQEDPRDFTNSEAISTTGFSLQGTYTCGRKINFYHANQNDADNGLVTEDNSGKHYLRILTSENLPMEWSGGLASVSNSEEEPQKIEELLTEFAGSCGWMDFQAVQGNYYMISMGSPNNPERVMNVWVQLLWWGMNVWVELKAGMPRENESGLCVDGGEFHQLPCMESQIRWYPSGCDDGQDGRPIRDYPPEPTTRPTEPGYALCGMKDTDEGFPHINRYFDGPAEEYAYRGEFQYYKSFPWISVQMRRQEDPRNFNNGAAISTTGFSLQGTYTCGNKLNFYYANQENADAGLITDENAVPHLRVLTGENMPMQWSGGWAFVQNDEGGENKIEEILTELADDCAWMDAQYVEEYDYYLIKMGNANNPGDRVMSVSIQFLKWGMNVWVELHAGMPRENESGLCVDSGEFHQLPCQKSHMRWYPNGCDDNGEDRPIRDFPPSMMPTAEPTPLPTPAPSDAPTASPSAAPTLAPTDATTDSPTPLPTLQGLPGPAVSFESCSSLGDPHLRFFDGSRANFMDRGEFKLYDTQGVRMMVRQGAHPKAQHSNLVSTNHGLSISGEMVCGLTIQVFHARPESAHLLAENPGLANPWIIVDNGDESQVHSGFESVFNILELWAGECGEFGVFRQEDIKPGSLPIIEVSMAGGNIRARFQFNSFGMNVWVDVAESLRRGSDSGLCTKRFNQVGCRRTDFSLFPGGRDACRDLDRTEGGVPHPVVQQCSEALKLQAKEVCDVCPETVAIDDCVYDVCALGDITAAEDAMNACTIGQPIGPLSVPAPVAGGDETCGEPGKVSRGEATKVKDMQVELGGIKKAATACICRNACLAAGGSEWMWKPSGGRCMCFDDAASVTFIAGSERRIAGVLEGSQAVVSRHD